MACPNTKSQAPVVTFTRVTMALVDPHRVRTGDPVKINWLG